MIIKNNALVKVTDADIQYGTFKIPENVEALAALSFRFCDNLISIDIPSNVKAIGEYAFDMCTGLRQINISNGVKIICKNAFDFCSELERIIIPDSVEMLEGEAFKNCRNLKNIKLSNNLTSIERETFLFCDKLKELNIPASVIYISDDITGEFRKIKLVLESSLTRVNIKKHKVIINGKRIKNEKQLEKVRKKEILNKIIEQLKEKNINKRKYFKYKEHENFIERILSAFVYENIDFKKSINIYISNYLTSKGFIPGVTPINLTEVNDIKELIDDKIDEKGEITLPIDSEISIKNNEENNKKIVLEKLNKLPKEDIALIMDIVKGNLLDSNIEEYISMSNEEKLKLLENKSYKVNLEKEPIEEYKARQKVKK